MTEQNSAQGTTKAVSAVVARVNIIGVGVSAVTLAQVLELIEGWIQRREQRYVCVTGVHGLMESRRDAGLRAIHNAAGLVTPDGMPLVWLSRRKGHSGVERVYGPDLMLASCQRSVERQYGHYLYGGREGVTETLAKRLRSRFRGLRIVGWESPPFRQLTPKEDDEAVRRIEDASPDIVWIGLGTPKQERWMAAHRHKLQAPVLVGVGAAFDIHAGIKPQAPRWMQHSGLEWAYRLAHEPRRLWRRYLLNNPMFLAHVLMQGAVPGRYDLSGAELAQAANGSGEQ